MITAVGEKISFYNTVAGIEKNAMLNRAVMETFGVEIPFTLMSNNRDEMFERGFRALLFMIAAFVAPVVTMPLINKAVLKKSGIFKSAMDVDVLRISKKYLTGSAELLKEGFEKTAEKLEKQDKFKNIRETYNSLLKRYSGENINGLKDKLITAHQRIFSINYAISSLSFMLVPWLGNFVTEKRTGRKGYVGEFKMAESDYTNKMSKKHDQQKIVKMCAAPFLAIVPAILVPKFAAKVMKKPVSELGKVGQFFKLKADLFDYNDLIYMSKAGLFAAMSFGDLPNAMIACRDRHELEYKCGVWFFLYVMLFGCEPVLNNAVGRAFDYHLKTSIMAKDGYENAGFWKRFGMSPKKLHEIKNCAKTNLLSKKLALGMYIGNFILTTALLGFGMPLFFNKRLRKNVKEDLAKVQQTKTEPIGSQPGFNLRQNLTMQEFVSDTQGKLSY